MNYEVEVSKRDTGPNLPVSIGTAFAIEVLGGHAEGRDPEPESKILPDELWINVRTLFRNLYNAVDKSIKVGVIAGDFVSTLDDEMRLIREYVRDATGDKVKVVYYACHYRNINSMFPKAKLKEPSTDGQRFYTSCENLLIDHYEEAEESEVVVYRNTLEPTHNNVWLLTSTSIDLLELGKFKRGLLLESHTGKLKNTIQLYSKLTNGTKMGNIPFNKLTLQVFGDKSTLFSPFPKVIKDAIMEVAKQGKWTPATKLPKVKYDIGGMKDRLGSRALLELL